MILLFLLIFTVSAYNLVVDVNPQGVHRYLESFGSYYVQQLTDHEIPLIEKNRCLGKIAIASTTIRNVEIENTKAIMHQGDYYLQVTHLHAHLHGEYKHNVLFVHQQDDFDLRLRDLNATIGPLIPVAISGLPFIDSNVGCRISHAEDNFDVHGGILKIVAKKRIRETLETDLQALLCESFIDILDKGVRLTLETVKLKPTLPNGNILSFSLSRYPLMLPTHGIRFFHEGVTAHSNNKNSRFDAEIIENNFDVIYHIHQNLITEALTVACRQFEKEVLTTKIKCHQVDANFTEGVSEGTSNTVIITANFQENDQNRTRTYNSHILYDDKLILFMRLKSETLVPGTRGDEFSRQLFATLSEDIKEKFQIPLPIPKMLKMQDMHVIFKPNQLVLGGNLK